jgi:hypothetical protein
MSRKVLPLALVSAALAADAMAASARHFDVLASFTPPKKAGGVGTVAVTFRALEPDLKLNETPAPRLKLDLAQLVLEDKQPPPSGEVPVYDPLTAKYLDLAKPILFPAALLPAAPRGESLVKASVVFFYCSEREDWCRRGTAEVEIPVTVP